ncbi:MAG TPA: hypothetical protein DCL54_00980 [Alphaproteobacteria bacterium]|nr:hypothetical protein [Alphaproteobacteria bacterium]HAJ45140.1 hypothetical protein [Alphaproteobacteria bacterium]
MRTFLIIVLVLIALAAAAFFLLVLFLSGGTDRWAAERATSARGYTASEPHQAPGFKQLLIPKEWKRDTYQEIFSRNSNDPPYSGLPKQSVTLNSLNEAMLFLSLGQYSHVGGTAYSANAVLYVRMPEAPVWTIAEGRYGDGRDDYTKWTRAKGADGIEAYVPQNDETQDRGVQVIVHDAKRRARIYVRTTANFYTQEQAITLGQSILNSIIPDDAALIAARDEALARLQKDAEDAAVSMEKITSILGLTAPLAKGLTVTPDGSVIRVTDDWQLSAYVRLGTVPLEGRSAQAVADSLTLDPEQVGKLAKPTNRERSMGASLAEILAIWRKDDSLTMHSLELGREIGSYPLNEGLPNALFEALPPDALAIYRTIDWPLIDTARLETWFQETRALRDAAAAGTPPWIRKTK